MSLHNGHDNGEEARTHSVDLRIFKGTEAWVFDLDNTLYPADASLFAQINDKISDYVARLLKVGKQEAKKRQLAYYHEYGTTLRGLMIEHNVDPDDFLHHAHNIDYSDVEPNPALGHAIAALPGRKFIFTNGDRPHAERTAAALGITHHFEDIFDIVAAGLLPKPNRETYDLFITKTGVSPARAAMFEDLSKNLHVPHKLGMRTTLIVPNGTRSVFQDSWDMEKTDTGHVDFVTDDLTGFLSSVSSALNT